ncbi:RdgB/HAM1 family non-canonical purine NTP pyrophosphatase [Pseudopelagicola sp. nBUS_19]|uniref:RdgB/HAM1 family non-canonical purine NTP pyrophosphatase n=1 Tax=Pseudopelagicola sp. nBUS_19 TaxID=3395316 RepID=UPI003EC0CE1B
MIRKFSGQTLLVATHNIGKLEEVAHLLEPFGIAVVGAKEMKLPEPRETENTFVGNARIKAHAAARSTGLPSLADDSGITIDGLNGAPGVYTADWAETGSGRDFEMAMSRAHDELLKNGTEQPWLAQFRCTLVLAWPDGHDEIFDGIAQGHLIWPPRGLDGFGYDPMFIPDGYNVTFSEMDRWEKNKISHRANAVEKFVAGCFG